MKLELYSSCNYEKTKCTLGMMESHLENSTAQHQSDRIFNHGHVYKRHKEKMIKANSFFNFKGCFLYTISLFTE